MAVRWGCQCYKPTDPQGASWREHSVAINTATVETTGCANPQTAIWD